ncbi:MAG: hypothetical protein ACYCX4_00925 [Bacillota bacterium]
MVCPLCGGKAVGKIGSDQFYCWDCLVEYDAANKIYQVAEDGSLIAFSQEPTSELL